MGSTWHFLCENPGCCMVRGTGLMLDSSLLNCTELNQSLAASVGARASPQPVYSRVHFLDPCPISEPGTQGRPTASACLWPSPTLVHCHPEATVGLLGTPETPCSFY